jgi:hypothetical protein
MKGEQIFQKSRNHLKIIGARRVTRSRFHTEGPQMSGTTVKKFIQPGDLAPGICAP